MPNKLDDFDMFQGLERRDEPLLPHSSFMQRLARYAGVALLLILVSLGIGILGYHTLEGLSWVDALLNAAMLLGGMGPVNALHTTVGKLFASFYALFAGMIFLVIVGILLTSIIHRFQHRFHLELDDEKEQ